jgi:hypothetical protein
MGKSEQKLLIIVNNIPPYGAEMITVLASPCHVTCRFRYYDKYAPTINDVPMLVGKEGTIVLRNRQSAAFMPIRTFEVITSRKVGDIIHLVVELGNIAALGPDSDRCEHQLKEFATHVSEAIGAYPNPPGDELMNLILYERGSVYGCMMQWYEASTKDELSHWGKCIPLLSDFGISGDSALSHDFYKLIDIRDSRGHEVNYQNGCPSKRGFRVCTGQSYTLAVVQRTYTKKKGDSSAGGCRFLEFQSADNRLNIIRGVRPIIGKYDIHTFYISVPADGAQGAIQTFLRVRNNDDQTTQNPVLDLPLVIIPPWHEVYRRKASVTLFLVFLLGYLLSDWLALRLPASWQTQPSIIEKLSLIGMIVTANSGGLFAREISSKFYLGSR